MCGTSRGAVRLAHRAKVAEGRLQGNRHEFREQRSRLSSRDQEQQPWTCAEPAPAPADSAAQERRRNPRYKCEGSATFRVQGGNVRSWGTFTDLSISGCYVELKATFPVGAMLELELELNGVRTHLTGEVRVRYPFLGMGVAFRDMTTENHMQIEAMIESVRPAPRPPLFLPIQFIPLPCRLF